MGGGRGGWGDCGAGGIAGGGGRVGVGWREGVGVGKRRRGVWVWLFVMWDESMYNIMRYHTTRMVVIVMIS